MTPNYESLISSATNVITSKRRNYADKTDIIARQTANGVTITIPKHLAAKLSFTLRQRFAIIQLPNGAWALVPHREGVVLSDGGGVQLLVRFSAIDFGPETFGDTLKADLTEGLITFPAPSFQLNS